MMKDEIVVDEDKMTNDSVMYTKLLVIIIYILVVYIP